MNNQRQYQKLFSRDFSLPSVEAWVRGESINPKGWTKEKQPFLPYIITERSDDTVHFYYDLEGVNWVQNLIIRMAKKDKNFIPNLEKIVLEKISFIRPIYEKEKAISLSELKRFLKNLESAYPWLEAMWWFFQMDDPNKTSDLDLKKLAKIMSTNDKLCNSSDSVIRQSLIKIYPHLRELSSVLKIEEIINERIPSKEILEKRYKGYYFLQDTIYINVNKEGIEKILSISFVREQVKKVRQISGSPAYRGIVRGFVRRVMGHKQISEMREGEILVSPMTIPDFIPAIKKAAAIVTDEGGVLSHAAIVARESEIPTVVGTSIASKRLKDGDIVEVNATEGKINLICHASIISNKLKKPCVIGTHFATDIFEDGDYIEVNADKGLITLLNKKETKPSIKKIMPFNALFQ